MSIIRLENVNRTYRADIVETIALENINLEVEEGEFISIMGPSGCGKSTLLNVMGTLDCPTSGRVILRGQEVSTMSAKEQARFRNANLGFVFQSFHLIGSLSVYENVEVPLLYGKVPRSERKARIEEVLARVGLSHRRNHLPSQLSGGQCQRVAIARAIVGRPSIILADEPTGNLDSHMGGEIMELLHQLNQEDRSTIVMVTHNEEQANETRRIVRLLDGAQVA